MKHIFCLCSAMLLSLSIYASLCENLSYHDQYSQKIGGLYYKFQNEEAIVVARWSTYCLDYPYNNYWGKSTDISGAISIPKTVVSNGRTYSITTFEESAFVDSHVTKTNYMGTIADWCKIKFGSSSANPMYYSHNFFINDVEVKDLVIPEGVDTIKSDAFYGCSGLISVTIPNSVTEIGYDAFCDCSGLTFITCYATTPPTCGRSCFYDVSKSIPVYVPIQSINAYRQANGWKDFNICSIENVSVSANNSAFGSVQGGGHQQSENVTITATANYGYHFVQWNDGITDNPRNFVFTQDTSFVAEFAPNQYLISVEAEHGDVNGGGYYEYLSSAQISATADEHYHFVKWDDGNTSNPRTVSVIGDKTYTAIFALNQHTVSATVNYGIVSGTGKYDYGKKVTLTATANYGYHFVQWNDGVTDNPRSFTLTQDTSFIAQIAVNQYTLTAQSADNTKGTVTGGGIYDYQSQPTITAVANYGYRFLKWNDGNTANPRKFTLTKDTTFIAQFTPKNYQVSVQNANPTMGGVFGSGSYSYLSAQTISATANYGYHFVQWNDGITDNPRTIQVLGDTTFTATFAKNIYSISVEAEHGEVNGGGYYEYLSSAQISATADEHYHFVKWSDGNTSNPRTISVTGDKTYTAIFALDQHTVSAMADHGNVSGTGTYNYGSEISLMVTPSYGYHFTQWNDGITDNPRSFTLTQDTSFAAQCDKNTYTISTAVNDDQRGMVQGGNSALYLDEITLTAISNYGYHFTQWSDGNTSNPRIVKVTENKTYTAQFDKNQYVVTVNKGEHIQSVVGAGTYEYMDEITLSVTAETYYRFDRWSDGNTDNPRVLVVTQDTSFSAISAKITSGTCGDNLKWNYNDGILVISGTGAMYDYTQGTTPWVLFQDSINSLVINNGCTSIGNFAFYGLSNKNLKTIDIPNSVERIGQYAFANCEYLKNLYLGLSLEKIAANAFANDERLLYITCYAIEPPLLDESAFVNYDVYLSVPCESQADYKVAKGWKNFNKENVSCIGAEETPVTNDEVTVAPEANQATFTWPANDQAAGYSIEITKDGVVFCTLKFNAQGQLTGIAFAPSRDGEREMPSATMTANGWQFTVTGLNTASKYAYTIDALNAGQQSIKHYEGEFATDGYTGLDRFTDSPASRFTKIVKDGRLLINRNGKIYNALGF